MKASIDTLKYSVVAAAAIVARQLVGFDDRPAGADAPVQGVAAHDAATGEAVALTAVGLIDLEAGAAIAKGDELVSNAAGKPVPKGAGTNVFGRALNAASLGGRVTVLLR